jgi:hypothetical protein
MSKKMFSMLLTLFFAISALGELILSVYGSYFFPELFISRISAAHFPRFSLNLMFLCRIRSEIASGQIQDSKIKDVKISTPGHLREFLYTDSQDMLVHYPLPLHRATTTAAPVPESMDTPRIL